MKNIKKLVTLFLALGITLAFSVSHAELDLEDQRILASADDNRDMEDSGDDLLEDVENSGKEKANKAKAKAKKKKNRVKAKAKKRAKKVRAKRKKMKDKMGH